MPPTATRAIFTLLPVDGFVDDPIRRMEVVGEPNTVLEIHREVLAEARGRGGTVASARIARAPRVLRHRARRVHGHPDHRERTLRLLSCPRGGRLRLRRWSPLSMPAIKPSTTSLPHRAHAGLTTGPAACSSCLWETFATKNRLKSLTDPAAHEAAWYAHLTRDSVKAAVERVSVSLAADLDTPPNAPPTSQDSSQLCAE